jgi:RNA chaperone Hfq
MVNRKLIRPNLAELKERLRRIVRTGAASPAERLPGREPQSTGSSGRPGNPGRAISKTSASSAGKYQRRAFYYVKQMTNHTPMVVVLDNGEQLRGHIEWYDRNCIKLNREGTPNLLVYKHAIKFMYKQEEETPAG